MGHKNKCQKSERVSLGSNHNISRHSLLLEAHGEDLFLCLFWLLEATWVPSIMASSKPEMNRFPVSL